MKKPSKTAGELEASIKVQMEDICDLPTGITISVQPDGKVVVSLISALCLTGYKLKCRAQKNILTNRA